VSTAAGWLYRLWMTQLRHRRKPPAAKKADAVDPEEQKQLEFVKQYVQ
jgi:hypothetical protein